MQQKLYEVMNSCAKYLYFVFILQETPDSQKHFLIPQYNIKKRNREKTIWKIITMIIIYVKHPAVHVRFNLKDLKIVIQLHHDSFLIKNDKSRNILQHKISPHSKSKTTFPHEIWLKRIIFSRGAFDLKPKVTKCTSFNHVTCPLIIFFFGVRVTRHN